MYLYKTPHYTQLYPTKQCKASQAKQRLPIQHPTSDGEAEQPEYRPHEFYVKKSGSVDVKKGLLSERSEF